jgi:methyl-accepting chemotaxis protein
MAAGIKRRQDPIVDRELQYRFFALILVYGAIILLFLAVTLFVPNILDMINEDLSLVERGAAGNRILGYHSWAWFAALALLFLLGIHSVRIFHRLVGPLYRFRLAFEKIKEGDLSVRVRLRKEDYLHKEEDAINEMVEVFEGKWEQVRCSLWAALEVLDSLEQAVTQVRGWREEDQQLLRNQRRHLEAMANAVQYFQVKEGEELE